MIKAADDESLWDSFLHAPIAPAISQRALVELYAGVAGVAAPKVGRIPTWPMKAIGTVHAGTRELAEMIYQFDKPFVLDSSASESLLGLPPTALETGAMATVDWWRTQA